MSEVTKVVCDACSTDLTTTGNSVDYRLRLASEEKLSWGGAVTDMMIYPALERPARPECDGCERAWPCREQAAAVASLTALYEGLNR